MKSIIKATLLTTAVSTAMLMTACDKKPMAEADHAEHQHHEGKQATVEKGQEVQTLLNSYADIALAGYQDSLSGAKKLQLAIDDFVAKPTQANLDTVKAVYKEARQPYSQTEVFRFDEGFITANDTREIESVDGWEGQLNAWPLDEALIDYVSDSYEGEYSEAENIINSDSITIGSETKDVSVITPELLASLNEFGGSEANVASGYHAIEFLLWGQDTNGTGEGAGNRPVTDFATDSTCTNGDAKACQRRGEYLKAAAQLLVTDLEGMVAQWQPDSENTLRSDLMARADDNAVRQIMYQMGSLALGELASERMQVAFVTGSTEDEHECFSDLTHLSYAQNAQGIKNVFEGSYDSKNGNIGGYGIKQYLIDMGKQQEADQLQAQFDAVTAAFDVIVEQGENKGVKVDQMIATVAQAGKHDVSKEEQQTRRGWIQAAITDLQEVTNGIEAAAASLGIDKLDADTGTQF